MSGLVWAGQTSRRRLAGFAFFFLGVLAFGALAGCGAGSQGVRTTVLNAHLRGSLHGGQQPVSQSAVQIYAMGTTGSGSAATPLLSQPVYTDANGAFSVSTIPCPSAASQLYIVSIAGNPGLAPGANNPNLAEMALLGPCGSISDSTTVVINEVTTVAAAYALAPFMQGYQQVGSGPDDTASLVSAISTANALVNFSNGSAPGPSGTAGWIAPTQKLQTLANILAACVNSLGGQAGDGSVCGSLFTNTATSGQPFPGDTITAALRIAENPTSNVAQIYSLSGWAAPFQPSLAAAPADWNLLFSSSVSAPVFQPAGGSYDSGQTVTLSSSDPTARIFYTTDGSTPSQTSNLYSGPLTLNVSTVIRAVAIAAGLSSIPAQASYNVGAIHLAFVANPGTTVAGAALTPTPTVAFETASGKILTSLSGPITVHLNANGANASLAGNVTVSAVQGKATFPGLSINNAGTALTLSATASGAASGTSTSFDVQAAATQSTQGSTYYLAANGNDNNTGISAAAPWLTPNHALNCGDTIIAAPSSQYQSTSFGLGAWGHVNCPGNNNVVWLKCAQFDSCKITVPGNVRNFGMAVTESYWGVEGFEVYSPGNLSNGLACFEAVPGSGGRTIHHIIFANNVANTCPQAGFGMGVYYGSVASVDYYVAVGNIAYNTATSNTDCASAINLFSPVAADSAAGTHIYIAGNFVYSTVNPPNCWDGNGILFDTFEGYNVPGMVPYTQQAVIDNNITISNAGVGVRVEYNNAGNGSVHAPIYIRHNTAWNNSGSPYQNGSSTCGEIQLQKTQTTTVTQNIAMTNQFGCFGSDWFQLAAYQVNSSDGSNVVDNNVAWSNWGFLTQMLNTWGFSFGSTIGLNPRFANPTTPGAPNCSGTSNAPSCMSTLVAGFTPNNSSIASYGYQVPGQSPVKDDLFPKWLCSANLPQGLVTMGCL